MQTTKAVNLIKDFDYTMLLRRRRYWKLGGFDDLLPNIRLGSAPALHNEIFVTGSRRIPHITPRCDTLVRNHSANCLVGSRSNLKQGGPSDGSSIHCYQHCANWDNLGTTFF